MSWIKVPYDLPEMPEVIAIATRLGIDWDSAVGKLVLVWTWFDAHADDWSAGIPPSFIDKRAYCHGFADALTAVGWLQVHENTLTVTSPDSLCGGSSARRPMQTQTDASDFAAQLYANGKRCGQPITKEQWTTVLDHFGFACALCGSHGVPLTIEHLHPVSRGGGNEVGNIVPACEPCNYSKGDRFPLEWFVARRAN